MPPSLRCEQGTEMARGIGHDGDFRTQRQKVCPARLPAYVCPGIPTAQPSAGHTGPALSLSGLAVPSSRASIFSITSPITSASCGESASNTSRRTVATCAGAACSITALPCSVSTTQAPRPSSRHSSRRTRPRRSMRVTWWETRLRSQCSPRARSLTRTRASGRSVSWTSTSKSGRDRPASAWSSRCNTPGSSALSRSQRRHSC